MADQDGQDADGGTAGKPAGSHGPSQRRGSAPSLEEQIAQIETAMGTAIYDFEPDEGEPDLFPGPVRPAASARPAPAPPPTRAATATAPPRDPATASDPTPAAATVVPQDGAGTDGEDTLVLDGDAQVAGLGPGTPEPQTGDSSGRLDLGGVKVDQETFRAVVAWIMRAEFQGTFGEQVTGNIRDLVRREIRRILAEKS